MVIRIVLVGETCTGKSFTGNSILGSSVFPVSTKGGPMTKVCSVGETSRFGTPFKVVDTPGVFFGKDVDEEIKHNMQKCVDLTYPGPQVFLFVFSCASRFCENDLYVINLYKDYFGEDIFKHGVVLFTHKNSKLCKGSIPNFLRSSPKALQDFVALCGNRVLPIENTAPKEMEVSLRILVDVIVGLANEINVQHLNLDSVNNNCADRVSNSVANQSPNSPLSTESGSSETDRLSGSNETKGKGKEQSTKPLKSPKKVKIRPPIYNCTDELVKQQIRLLSSEMDKMSDTRKLLKEEIMKQQMLPPNDSDATWCVLAGEGLSMIIEFDEIVKELLGPDIKSLLLNAA